MTEPSSKSLNPQPHSTPLRTELRPPECQARSCQAEILRIDLAKVEIYVIELGQGHRGPCRRPAAGGRRKMKGHDAGASEASDTTSEASGAREANFLLESAVTH